MPVHPKTLARRHQFLHKLKEDRGCMLCGTEENLVFHHVVGEEKLFKVSKVNTGRSPRTIVDEVRKCVVLCKECHDSLGLFEHMRIFLDWNMGRAWDEWGETLSAWVEKESDNGYTRRKSVELVQEKPTGPANGKRTAA